MSNETKWILAFDCETNGKAKNFKAPHNDTDNWPRLVQLGMVVANSEGRVVYRSERMIASKKQWTIDPVAESIHGIPLELCDLVGVPAGEAIRDLRVMIGFADVVIAHNMAFDWPVVCCESIRDFYPFEAAWHSKRRCTMELGTGICKIPGPYGYKWPRLDELHQHLMGESFDGAHSALADAEACLRCYLKMQDSNLI